MPRVSTSVASRKKRKRIFAAVKGQFGRRKNLIRTAREAMEKSWNYAYIGRKLKKRDFRSLWIVRINAACRDNQISYSQFINGLKKASIALNRKMLSEIAIHDPVAFTNLVMNVKQALA
ncbi:MAG: 50S ribosomal protein L20 [Candidatus Delongbacteria bacterium]|nr:50S ribosomal protein L20 [Candidatus Delongbacteria bacterium]